MTVLTRAWTAVTRRLTRSLIILAVMALIFTLLISTVAVRQTMANLRLNVERNIRAGFSLSGTKGEGLPIKDADAVRHLAGIGAHNYQMQTAARPNGLALIDGGIQLSDEADAAAGVTGTTDSQSLSQFTGRLYQLEQGKHLSKDSQQSALIHTVFAQKNGLKLGDRIQLQQGDRQVDLTITGIFSGKTDKPGPLPSDQAENQIITSLAVAQQLSGSGQLTRATYFASNPRALPDLVRRAKTLPLDWSKLELTDNAASFASVINSIAGIERILAIGTLGISLAGLATLSLVLVFWVRSRIHEIGTLLAIGTSKRQIAEQVMVELLLVAIAALLVATLSGQALSHHLTANLLNNSSHVASTLTVQPQTAPLVSYLLAASLGLAVVAASGIVALAPILRRTPKQILTTLR
ncbi:MAG: ABC transporter permease [Candidatus Saccharimonas sp.]|jgi:hypothetical protein cdivTM_12249